MFYEFDRNNWRVLIIFFVGFHGSCNIFFAILRKTTDGFLKLSWHRILYVPRRKDSIKMQSAALCSRKSMCSSMYELNKIMIYMLKNQFEKGYDD